MSETINSELSHTFKEHNISNLQWQPYLNY